jgi:hypothetical protein
MALAFSAAAFANDSIAARVCSLTDELLVMVQLDTLLAVRWKMVKVLNKQE